MSTSPRVRLRATVAGAAIVPLVLTLGVGVGAGAATADPPVEQPELGTRVKEIIDVDGLQFRDLDDDGELDVYEDWRESTPDRVADLVSQMNLEEKAGLMLIDTLNAACIDGDRGAVPENGYDFVENQHMTRFIFRNTVAGEDDAVCGEEGGGFRATTVVTPAEAAEFTNAVQEMTEATRLGIPSLFKSNARNHIDPNARAGINESAGAFSAFPKEAGIAAAALGAESLATGADPTTGDMSVVEGFANVMGDEWASIGLRGMYGYMADLSTEPRWYRTHETFTEDAYHAAAIMETLVETLQGEEITDNGLALSPETRVALTLKHFPGGGPQELGLDPHYAFGKAQVYPTGLFEEHFLPFEAAIDAGVSSIMPYYGVPVNVPEVGNETENYPHTGFAFSDSIVNGLLRDQLGFTGYVNSDTGIINDRAWGMEDATVPERVAAAINGGTDTLSGFNQVQVIIDLVEADLITEERVDLAAERLLEPLFDMGLFENPYVDPDVATATVGADANRALGVDLQRQSLVLLQNEETDDGPVLPLEDGSDVYILGDFTEETVAARGYDVTNGNVEQGETRPSAEDSDYVLISMTALSSGPDYVSNSVESGLNPEHGTSPSIILDADGNPLPGLDGESLWGAADVCSWDANEDTCTDSTLRFGGAYPWESDILDFTGMQAAESWRVVPSLDVIQEVMNEVDDPSKVVLHVYFRQPYVLDVDSGLRDAGAILAGFGMTDSALLDVLSGDFAPQGKMPFALAGTPEAIVQQASDAPGYEDTDDGALFPFGFGLTYEDDTAEPPSSTLNAIPTVDGPIAETDDSYLWSTMERARVPFDVADHGFVEEEFFLSGTANVYDGGDGQTVVDEEEVPYANHILVRRPADAADASGVVLVDILNASNGFPGEDHWRRMWGWALEEGHTVIGMSSKPIQIDALHNFDPERYADLTWDVDPDVERDPIVADPDDPSAFDPHMVVEGAEEGLAWDIITQLGVLLESDEAGSVLGGQVPQTTLLMGQSQSGVYLNTYTTNFHEAQAEANGGSVWDGYLNSVGAVLERPLQQSDEGGLEFGPGSEPGFDVPFITVTAEGDAGLFGAATLAETDLPDNRFHWQVPGTPHTDLLSPVIPADEEIYKAGRLPNTQVHDADFRAALNLYPLEPAIIAAAQALVDAHQDGVAPAASQWITQGNSFVRDDAGNALGGVRYGLIEYPLGQYLGAAQEGAVYGSMELISAEEFAEVYGTRAAYLDLVAEYDAGQIEAGYLTAFGAEYFRDVANELLDRIGVPADDDTSPTDEPTTDGPKDPGGSLPETGASISGWLALAIVGLLALGVSLVAIRRRAMSRAS